MDGFNEKLEQGQHIERCIDRALARHYELTPVSLETEKQDGVDRIGTRRDNGAQTRFEYKADFVSQRTRNAYIETKRWDGTPSWGYTSRADYIIIALPADCIALVFKPTTLAEHLPEWEKQYGTRAVWTKGRFKDYQTWGTPVPLDVMSPLAVGRFFVPTEMGAN